ncbi:MAG: D-alanine--D-alanine ligase [Candidatus Omnitrophica bacterium]|nr:D-alanine--D-alanine ligase [Candidatus Omnitrophota bacterium]
MEINKTQNAKRKTQNGFGKIGVLMGGPSAEREISLKSGKAVLESLKALNLDVVDIDIQTDNSQENINLITSRGIDCAFLTLHGRFGEDGQMQAILEELGIPYTGSGKFASRLAMDKISSRKILEVYGLSVPRFQTMEKKSYQKDSIINSELIFPLVVKPAMQGSSIGLSIVDTKNDLANAIKLAFEFDDKVLIEEYIKGRELTVGILDNRALPAIEIVPKKRFFDYEAKYSAGLTEYIVPAQLSQEIASKIEAAALKVHHLLGCYAYSRIDIILNQENVPFILEANTIPGFTRTSLYPKAAKVAGIEFGQLCLELIRLAHDKI